MEIKFKIDGVYHANYCWITYKNTFMPTIQKDTEIFCALCKKSQAEIKKTESLEEHINNHVIEEKYGK